jgi:ketosteroid isomerase-like protein
VDEERRTLIRGIYGAINRRDVDALRELAAGFADFEWSPSADEVDAETRRGAASALARVRDLLELFADMDVEEALEAARS